MSVPKNEVSTGAAIKPWLLPLGAMGVLFAGMVVQGVHEQSTDPKLKYQQLYIDGGQCLHQTPFDPVLGADLLERKIQGKDTLTVVPEYPNAYSPASVLSFDVQTTGWFGVEIEAADQPTEAFLKAQCTD